MEASVNDPSYIRNLVITANQSKILKSIKKQDSVDSNWLSGTGISLQSASAQLTKLFKKGYLSRKEVRDPTGGFKYVYKSMI